MRILSGVGEIYRFPAVVSRAENRGLKQRVGQSGGCPLESVGVIDIITLAEDSLRLDILREHHAGDLLNMADEMIIVGFPLSIAGIIKAGLGQEMKQYSDLRSLPQSLSHVSVCS